MPRLKKLFLYSAGKSQKVVSRSFTEKAIKHNGCFIAVKRPNERFLNPRFFLLRFCFGVRFPTIYALKKLNWSIFEYFSGSKKLNFWFVAKALKKLFVKCNVIL